MLLFRCTDEERTGAASGSADGYTVEEAIEHLGFGWFQLKLLFVCGLFSVSYWSSLFILTLKISSNDVISKQSSSFIVSQLYLF